MSAVTLLTAHVGAGSFAPMAAAVVFATLLALRGARGRPSPSAALLTGGVALLVAVSPLVESRADGSFAVHMTQHLLLVGVAAPLWGLVAAHRWAFAGVAALTSSRVPVQHAGRAPGAVSVALATAASTGALLLWHLPVAWASALSTEWIHGTEHLTLVLSAYWFWSVVLDPRTSVALALPAILLVAVPQGLLGGLLTFSARPVYATQSVGADPLVDQQLAGLLMWVPGGLLHLGAAALVVIRSLERARRRVERRELARSSRRGEHLGVST